MEKKDAIDPQNKEDFLSKVDQNELSRKTRRSSQRHIITASESPVSSKQKSKQNNTNISTNKEIAETNESSNNAKRTSKSSRSISETSESKNNEKEFSRKNSINETLELKEPSDKKEIVPIKELENSIKSKWNVGMLVEAKDASGKWYKSRIVEIDEEEKQVKVHYLGWNSRYDQWFNTEGEELKPVLISNQNENSSSEGPKQVVEEQMDNTNHFEPDTQVLAKWNDNSYYPALVIKNLNRNGVSYYQVKKL
jgi:hypothetical protein